MNLYEVESALNHFLDNADNMDYQEGAGIRLLSKGTSTTREMLKGELGIFMLSLLDGFYTVTSDQKELLDLMLDKGFVYADSDDILQMADSIDVPDGRNNVSINAFVLHDLMATEATGEYVSTAADAMISLFRMLGGAFIAAGIGSNALAEIRRDSYISGLGSKALSARNDLSELASSLVKAQEPEETEPKPKEAESKPMKAASKPRGGRYKFDNDIVLELPDGYVHETVEKNGAVNEYIHYGKSKDDDGNDIYEFSATVDRIDCKPGEGEIRKPDETPLEVICRRAGPEIKKHEFGTKCMALSIKKPVRLFGTMLKYKIVALAKEIDADSAATLQIVYAQEDDPEKDRTIVKHLMKLFSCMSVKGKACSLTGLTEKKFTEISHCEFDEENDESAINLKVGVKISVNGGESIDAGEINLSEKRKTANEVELPEPETEPFRDMWESYHEHYTLVTSGSYTSHRDADFRGQSIRELMEKCGSTDEEAYELMEIPDDKYDLDKTALKLAKVFRMNPDNFDPYNDTEALIREKMFKDVRALHALRSMAWAIQIIVNRTGSDGSDISYEKLEEIAEFIQDRDYLAYDLIAPLGLCNHYDWHVFYTPDAYLNSNTYLETDLRNLTGKSDRGGNSSFVVMGGDLNALRKMNEINRIVGRNEETVKSLEDLRKELEKLKPVMETIHDGLLENRDRSEPLEGVLAEVLIAWCALAIAAKEPFYSEEAADSYEADAGLEGPLERPDDMLDDIPVKKTSSTAKKTTEGAKQKKKRSMKTIAKPVGDMLDLGGATVIEPGQFSANMNLKNIIIPEGVTEIGEQAFYSCMYLESVVFPSTLKKIGKMAFMSCRALRKAELPDGIEEIGDHAFGATNNLKEMRLPDSLKDVNKYLFGMGGDSPYATAYMSGTLACRLMETANQGQSWPRDAISARRYVIDGVGYEQMTDFWKKVKDGSVKAAQTEKTKAKSKSGAETEKKAKAATKEPAAKISSKTDKTEKPAEAPKASPKAASDKPTETKPRERAVITLAKVVNGVRYPKLKGTVVAADQNKEEDSDMPYVIPEGVTEIAQNAFHFSKTKSITCPKSLRIIRNSGMSNAYNLENFTIQEGLEEIYGFAFAFDRKLLTVHLPSTIRKVARDAFRSDIYDEDKSETTIYIPGIAAKRLVEGKKNKKKTAMVAKGFVIDGREYRTLEEYVEKYGGTIEEQEAKARKEREMAEQREREEREKAEQKARAEQERQEREKREAEAQKERKRNSLLARISELEKERDSAKGLFAGMKRNKIQKEIDALREEMKRI